jgi:hypothetical protein
MLGARTTRFEWCQAERDGLSLVIAADVLGDSRPWVNGNDSTVAASVASVAIAHPIAVDSAANASRGSRRDPNRAYEECPSLTFVRRLGVSAKWLENVTAIGLNSGTDSAWSAGVPWHIGQRAVVLGAVTGCAISGTLIGRLSRAGKPPR